MTSIVDVCNLALAEIGNRSSVSSVFPPDNSAQAQTAALFFQPKMQMLLRAANWDFARRQLVATQLKAVMINGQVSANPPPQPFLYEYAWPADCLRARFIMPTIPPQAGGVPLTTGQAVAPWAGYTPSTRVPFVVSSDLDNSNPPAPIKVILTNLPNAMLVYTADLSLLPDIWDAQFLAAATATLASYFIQALSRNNEQMNGQIALAKSAIEAARATNGNEGLQTSDAVVDWMQVRNSGWTPGWGATLGPNGTLGAVGWDQADLPGGLRF